MPLWKAFILGLYYQATLPLRWWDACGARARGRVPLAVLCYHRIADDRATSWTISNRCFARQIGWLRQHFELVSLTETQRRIQSGANQQPSVAITFDDGYSENCRHALPLLLREKIPCTYFVTAGNILGGLPFNHDLECHCAFAPNTVEELRAMAAEGIEIGAHGYNHLDLAGISEPERLQVEVVGARDVLRAAIGCPIRYFAFPFGQHAHLSCRAFDLAAAAGYEAVCSAYGGLNLPGEDAFHLQRIVADAVTVRVKNWLTGDRRKRHAPRFRWQPSEPLGEHHVPTPLADTFG
jgi:peptidoglycan/xylan/chitin deacetylase (PgdA/CDA1 family)